MTAQPDIHQRSKTVRIVSDSVATGGSILLSLSLFVILLAFFIVLTSISTYSEPKVEQAFTSLDITFSTTVPPSPFEKQTSDEREVTEGEGRGDSMEEMQDLLKSILPGLSVTLTDGQKTGNVMAVRMEKDRFDRLTAQLIPLFIRILNVKDGNGDYEISIISYVRDSLDEDAQLTFDTLEGYRETLIEKGLSADRIALSVEIGNPAYMLFQFDKRINP